MMRAFESIASQERKVPQVPESIMPAVLLQEQGTSVELGDLSEAPLSQEDFDTLQTSILQRQDERQRENEYHNVEHTQDVDRRFQLLAEMIGLSPREMQLGRVAALFHDDGHCGDTIRQDSVSGSYISNEEYAAYIAGQELEGEGDITSDDITFVQSAILATTFGQDNPDHPYQRNYGAHSAVEHLLKFADVASFMDGAEAVLVDSRKLQREGVKPVMNERETIADAQSFLSGYVTPMITLLEEVISAVYGTEKSRVLITEINQKIESVNESLQEKIAFHS